MRDAEKPDIPARLRLRTLPDRSRRLRVPERPRWLQRAQGRMGLTTLPSILFLALAATWAVVALTLFLGFYAVLWQTIFQEPPEGQEAVWDWRFSIAQLVALTTVMGAVVALPITINRLVLTRRQTETTEQGHITDRINTAVQGLGAEKEVNQIGRPVLFRVSDPDAGDHDERQTEIEWRDEPLQLPDGMRVSEEGKWQVFTQTQPNLEVRIGGIYALERIAQDSDRDHVQIMEILCAYIRQNAAGNNAALPPGEPPPEQWRKWAKEGQEYSRLDMSVALQVIERRGEDRKRQERAKNYRLGMERAPLRKIILSSRDLTGADLDSAELQGTNLEDAKLKHADLGSARLQGAFLWDAQLQRADLSGAQLQGADLSGAQLQGADLGRVSLDKYTVIMFANLWGAVISNVNFTDVPQIAEHLKVMFGDASVTLPGGHGPGHEDWPPHWPAFKLDWSDFTDEWRKWQAYQEGYTPPDPPDPDETA